MKRLLIGMDDQTEILQDGPEWADGFVFYGEFFHNILVDAELVFQVKVAK